SDRSNRKLLRPRAARALRSRDRAGLRLPREPSRGLLAARAACCDSGAGRDDVSRTRDQRRPPRPRKGAWPPRGALFCSGGSSSRALDRREVAADDEVVALALVVHAVGAEAVDVPAVLVDGAGAAIAVGAAPGVDDREAAASLRLDERALPFDPLVRVVRVIQPPVLHGQAEDERAQALLFRSGVGIAEARRLARVLRVLARDRGEKPEVLPRRIDPPALALALERPAVELGGAGDRERDHRPNGDPEKKLAPA